jgi:hypothetical protein
MPAIAALALAAPAAMAATQVNGEYQLMMQLRKDLRAFPWDFDSNDGAVGNPFELRLLSQPRAGAEAFLKVQAQWNPGDNNRLRPEFQYRESHLKFRREMRANGFESYLFSRQRRFWVDNYLVRFVDDREATGVRLNTWGFWGMNASFIVGDQSNQLDPANLITNYADRYGMPREFVPRDSLIAQARMRTDDLYVVRLRRDFLKERRLRVGFTWNRYEGWSGRDSVSDRGPWNSVTGFDTRYRWGDTDIAFEYGFSRQREGEASDIELSVLNHSTGLHIPDRSVMQAEVRSVRIGTVRTGYIAITPQWWARGPLYQNSLGGPGSDEVGFNIQTYYLLPERAVTLSHQLGGYGAKNDSRRRRVKDSYYEIYVEFINGFTGKSAYRRRDQHERDRQEELKDTFLSWTNELQVESRLAYLRVQSKLQNIGRPDHKQLFVIEDRINLTDRLKIYNRFALGNDPQRLRKGVFTQLQFRPTGSMEMFLQYGPDNIGGGSNPVEDDNLAGSGDQFDELKFILKGSF